MFDVPFPIQIIEVSHAMLVWAALLCQNNYLWWFVQPFELPDKYGCSSRAKIATSPSKYERKAKRPMMNWFDVEKRIWLGAYGTDQPTIRQNLNIWTTTTGWTACDALAHCAGSTIRRTNGFRKSFGRKMSQKTTQNLMFTKIKLNERNNLL